MSNDAHDRERTTDLGLVKINNEAISAIAYTAATQIRGVARLGGGLSRTICEKILRRSSSRGVRIKLNNGEIRLAVSIIVEYGIDIPRIADEVQESVKHAVEKMTGLVLSEVDIIVEGVNQPVVDKHVRRAA